VGGGGGGCIEPYRGWWDIPGGFLAPGEHPAMGAAREVLEETGLVVEPGELLGIWMDTYGAGDELAHTLNCYYVARVVGGVERPADDAAELGWFGPDHLPAEIAFAHAPPAGCSGRESAESRDSP
jgi:8-oxo-dGTP diphosphatase